MYILFTFFFFFNSNLFQIFNRIKERWAGILKNTKQHARALGSFVFLYKSMIYILKLIRTSRSSSTSSSNSSSISKISAKLLGGSTKSTLEEINNHEHGADAFIAGIVAGYIVFGHPGENTGLSSINQQMVLYVFSRIFLGICKYLLDKILLYLSTKAPLPKAHPSSSSHSGKINNSNSSHNNNNNKQHNHHHHSHKHVKGAIGVIDFANQARRLSPVAHAITNAAWAFFASACWGIVMYLFRKDSTLLQHSMIHSMKFLYIDSESWSSIWDFL